jgi:hypothetical protein
MGIQSMTSSLPELNSAPQVNSPSLPPTSLEALQAAKIVDRQTLLQQSPEIAQTQANQTLHTPLWVGPATTDWIERLPRTSEVPADSTLIPALLPIEAMSPLSPEALSQLLQRLQAAGVDLIVVGGQAINLWALQYYQPLPEWDELQPYTSVDLDFYGGRLEAAQCAAALAGQLTLARDFDPSPNAGVVQVNWGDRPFRIDILASVYGLADAEIANTALPFVGTAALEGIRLNVLHPLLCLEGKLKCLRGLDQTTRQDEKHVRLSLLIMHEFLLAQLMTQPPRSLLNLIERMIDNFGTDAGLHAWYRYGISLEAAIPITALQTKPDAQFHSFLERRWPQVIEQISLKRSRYQALMQH